MTAWLVAGAMCIEGFAQSSVTGRDLISRRLTPTVAEYAYGRESERQRLDFWRVDSDKPAPLVVLIHGGAWIHGDKSAYGTETIRPYLDAGIAVAAVNYRFIATAMEEGVEPPVKACLLDAARALQTLRHKAREWNIDPARVGLSGTSAGACTSIWLALHDDLADPGSSDPIARESTRVTCIAVLAPQTSLDPVQLRQWISNARYGGHAFGFARNGNTYLQQFELLLKNREKVLPWIREYSPIEHVSPDDPPAYMFFPKEKGEPAFGAAQPDPVHTAVQGIELAKALHSAGVEAIVTYPAKPCVQYPTMAAFLITKLNGSLMADSPSRQASFTKPGL